MTRRTRPTALYLLCATALLTLSASPAYAADNGRNVAVKLTESIKTPTRVISAEEKVALAEQRAELDLAVDPEQVICREERLGVSTRLKARKCRTIAEIRRLEAQNRNLYAQNRNRIGVSSSEFERRITRQTIQSARAARRARGNRR